MNTYRIFHDCCELEVKADSLSIAIVYMKEWFSIVKPGNGHGRLFKWNEYSHITENGIGI